MKRYEVSQITNSILEEMGGDPMDVCSGNCPEFAKSLVDKVGGQIVSNLSEGMEADLNGYEVISPEAYFQNPNTHTEASHCWVRVECEEGVFFFDAFDPQGVADESDLSFVDADWDEWNNR